MCRVWYYIRMSPETIPTVQEALEQAFRTVEARHDELKTLISGLNTFAEEVIGIMNKLPEKDKETNMVHVWNVLIRAHNILTHRYTNGPPELRQAVNNVLRYDPPKKDPTKDLKDSTKNLFIQEITLTHQGKKYEFFHDFSGPKQVVTVKSPPNDRLATGQPDASPQPVGPDGDRGQGPSAPAVPAMS